MLEVIAQGVDTVRAGFLLSGIVDVEDPLIRSALIANGFICNTQTSRSRGEQQTRTHFFHQSTGDPTLRYWLYGGAYVLVEFSAAALQGQSIHNLDLVSPIEVLGLLEVVRDYVRRLLPGSPGLSFHKLRRVDYACDIAIGDLPLDGLLSALSLFRIRKAKKVTAAIYPGESLLVRTKQFVFRVYDKAAQLQARLSTEESSQLNEELAQLREAGVVRLETTERPEGGMDLPFLVVSAATFAARLEYGLLGRGKIVILGMSQFLSQLMRLGLAPQERAAMLEYAVLLNCGGQAAVEAAYSRATYFRKTKMFYSLGLSPTIGDDRRVTFDLQAVIDAVFLIDSELKEGLDRFRTHMSLLRNGGSYVQA